MKSKLVVLAMAAAGLASPVMAQTVNLTIDGAPYSGGALSLDSFNLSGGELSISVTSSGSGGGGSTEPVLVTRTLSVTVPTNGTIRNVTAGQNLTSNQTFQYMSNESAPSVTLRLIADSGYATSAWGGSCSGVAKGSDCTLTMSSNRSVSATFQSESGDQGGGGSCGTTPEGVSIQNTSSIGSTFLDTVSNAATSRNQVFAYRFDTPNSNVKSKVDATRATGGEGKLVVISECPGSLTPAGNQSRCSTYSSESSVQWYNTDQNASRQCVLEKGKTYYANVFNRSGPTTPATCSVNCGFYFQKD